MITWFKAVRTDGSELDGMGMTCSVCAATFQVFERPYAVVHCGTVSAYVAPATLWERLTTPKLEQRLAYQPTRPAALTVLAGGWDGVTLPEEDPTEGLIGGPAL